LGVFCNFRRVFAEIVKKTAEKVQDFVKSCRKSEKVAENRQKVQKSIKKLQMGFLDKKCPRI